MGTKEYKDYKDWYKKVYKKDYTDDMGAPSREYQVESIDPETEEKILSTQTVGDLDYDLGRNLYNAYTQQKAYAETEANKIAAAQTEKETQSKQVDALYSKLQKYLSEKNKLRGISTLGVADSTYINAAARRTNALSDISKVASDATTAAREQYKTDFAELTGKTSENDYNIRKDYEVRAAEDRAEAAKEKQEKENNMINIQEQLATILADNTDMSYLSDEDKAKYSLMNNVYSTEAKTKAANYLKKPAIVARLGQEQIDYLNAWLDQGTILPVKETYLEGQGAIVGSSEWIRLEKEKLKDAKIESETVKGRGDFINSTDVPVSSGRFQVTVGGKVYDGRVKDFAPGAYKSAYDKITEADKEDVWTAPGFQEGGVSIKYYDGDWYLVSPTRGYAMKIRDRTGAMENSITSLLGEYEKIRAAEQD